MRGTLREAILLANDEVNNPGLDTISFAIPGTGPHTIVPASELPPITEPVVIDGYSQAGATENTLTHGTNAVLKIELDFTNVTRNSPGLTIGASNSTIKGLVINGLSGVPAITLRDSMTSIEPTATSGSVIEGNFIGTDPTGKVPRPGFGSTSPGILLANTNDNVIGGKTPAARNLISGINGPGISLGAGGAEFGTSNKNRVEGNLIGTDAAGTSSIPNVAGRRGFWARVREHHRRNIGRCTEHHLGQYANRRIHQHQPRHRCSG